MTPAQYAVIAIGLVCLLAAAVALVLLILAGLLQLGRLAFRRGARHRGGGR